jgi:hypothetical protein
MATIRPWRSISAAAAIGSPGGSNILIYNATTGLVQLQVVSAAAAVNGTAAYAEFCNQAGAVIFSMPVVQGTVPVADRVALNTLNLIAGLSVTPAGIFLG